MNNELFGMLGRNFLYDYKWQPPYIILFGAALVILAIWTIIWKGMALWKAARSGNRGWFVALLILNTIGILDILYIYVFSKKKRK